MLAFDHIGELPWCGDLSKEDKDKIRKLSSSAIERLRQLGITHHNSIAQSIANSLKNAGISREGITSILSTSGASYKDEVTDRDIEKVVNNAFNKRTNGRRANKWPKHDKELARHVINESSVKTSNDLAEEHGYETDSPVAALSLLYQPTNLLNLSSNSCNAGITKSLKRWLEDGIEGMNLIVPSPMAAVTGKTKEGKPSQRCLGNAGERLYQVVEFDKTPLEAQPAILDHLASIVPLVMVVHSGGKSLHGHFKVNHLNPIQQEQFMRYAVRLGADKALWTPCQYARLAGGKEEGREEQKILMFNSKGSEADFSKLPLKGEENIGKFTLIHADNIGFNNDNRDFVEELLTEGGLSMLFGAPSAGKSFFALDLAVAVATGRRWRDRDVTGGSVIYFCLEGHGGFRQRIEAQKQVGNLPPGDHEFYLVETHLNLLKPEDISLFIQAARAQVDQIKMVVIDTLAVSMAGGDENGADMTAAIEQAKFIGQELGCHVMLVHHTGKDASKGARGHSSQLGAVDTSISLAFVNGQRIAKVEKQKDFDAGDKFPFLLIRKVIGMNQRGKKITSCTVQPTAEEFNSPQKKGPQEKFPPSDLLEMLPQKNVASWKAKAIKNKWSDSTFRNKYKKLREGVDYEKSKDGTFVIKSEPSSGEVDYF